MTKTLHVASCTLLLAAVSQARPTSGALLVRDGTGQIGASCPLKRTEVRGEISGLLARVTVTQKFENPFSGAIEAIYTFPLPNNAAVDDMTMRIGGRVVRGSIKRKDEARAIYDAARRRGQLAGLLDQERPNIFVQSVANIPPNGKVDITISYVETLRFEDGAYEFVFPMVVGPRYNPQSPREVAPVTPQGARAGHDISIDLAVDAGMDIRTLTCPTHEIDVSRPEPRRATIRLKNQVEIPNKDFILRYSPSGEKIQDAVLAHSGARGGFFTLILQPPARVAQADITPKELVFVLDTSGSMSGFPIEKAKETMDLALTHMNPGDTFNLITFSGDTHILFPGPLPATAANIALAREFLASRRGSGGTEMMKAIRAALDPSDRQDHIRVVVFMTDGYVGNDHEIIEEVRRHPNARVFSFGVGSSVNRYLLDEMARQGRGEVEYVGLKDDGSAAARRLHERVRHPLLTNVEIDWGGLPVTEVYPARIPDLFSARPVVVTGRYTGPARGIIHLRGTMVGRPFVRSHTVDLPAAEPRHDTIAKLWARRKVGSLADPAAITTLALEFGLMTQYTSFVAVEESVVAQGGETRTIQVPVEMPEGVSYEGVFGERKDIAMSGVAFRPKAAMAREMQELDVRAPAAYKLTLKDDSEQVLAQLRKLGVQILAHIRATKTLLVRLPPDKLAAVSKLPFVLKLEPHR
jgi:Ca-activated chloride channel family protein